MRSTAEQATEEPESPCPFRTLAENALDLIVELDATGQITYVNGAARSRLGREPGELLGKPPWDLIHPDDVPLLARIFDDRMAGRKTVVRPICRIQHRTRGWLRYEIVGNRFQRAEGDGIVAIARELGEEGRGDSSQLEYTARMAAEVDAHTRELVRANERLRELQSRLIRAERLGAGEQLAGSIAHAINNPLAALIGTASMALEREPTQEMSRVLHLARRVQDVVWRTLRMFRGDSLQRSPLRVSALLEQIVSAVRPRFAHQGVELDLALVDDDGEILADAALLATAIESVLDNALESAGRGGKVRLGLSWIAGGRIARISVDDSGPGVPESIRERVFEPFFTTKGGGTGLGLAIARGIVEGHQGRIDLDDGPLGGARICIELEAGAPHTV